MPQLETIKCEKCGGEMKKRRETSTILALFLILIGFGLLFVIPVIGIVFLIIGLILGSKVRYLWVCQGCGYKFERQGTWRG